MNTIRSYTGNARRQGYARLPWLPAAVKAGNRFHYRRKNPWKHNLLNLSLLALLLLTGGGVLVLSKIVPAAVYLPLASLASGLLIFALLILVVHESTHTMFIIMRDGNLAKKLNRSLGRLICYPLGIDYKHHWQIGHITHHIDALEAHDPQNCPNTVLTGRALFKALLLDLIPGYAHLFRKYDDCDGPKQYPANYPMVMVQVAFWALLIWISLEYLNWTGPLAVFFGAQVTLMINRIKIAMEHGGPMLIRDNHWLKSASSFFPLRQLFMPFNISLHFEHHVNFNVPWYDLKQYHDLLLGIIPSKDQAKVFHKNSEVLAVIFSDDARREALNH
ncbi:MAG: fatty acid desaturase [Pseudomonadota bacterium]